MGKMGQTEKEREDVQQEKEEEEEEEEERRRRGDTETMAASLWSTATRLSSLCCDITYEIERRTGRRVEGETRQRDGKTSKKRRRQ